MRDARSLIDSHSVMSGKSANSIALTENSKDTLCRNITIYGRCRYEDKGTATLARLRIAISQTRTRSNRGYTTSRLRLQP